MGLLHWSIAVLAISAPPLVARAKATELTTVGLWFALSFVLVGLALVYLRHRSQLPRQRWNEHAREMNESVYELHRPVGDPNMQIIFFHGLQLEDVSEMHLSTWESEDGSCLWPKTWLAEDFPDAQILVVSYHQCLRKGPAGKFDMYNIGENLNDDLLQEGIGQWPDCPVVLVGHSFGGLVIKQLLCMQSEKARNSRTRGAKLKKFLDSVKGIVYYSTPHHGIPDIGRAEQAIGGPLFKFFTLLNTETARLNYSFQQLQESFPKWQIRGLGEGRPVRSGLFRGRLLVPEASAREGIPFNVDGTADHFSISKPRKKGSRGVKFLTELLRDISTDLKEKKLLDSKILQDARAHNFQRLPEHMKGSSSRLQQVKAKLESFRNLGFVGMGGLGKSTLAKAVFNELGPTFEYTCFVPHVKLIGGIGYDLKSEALLHMHYYGKKIELEDRWSELRGKKLLLIFDDIAIDRDLEVLLDIAGDSSPESRFIVTSRDKNLVKEFGEVYHVPLLNVHDSRQLFASHAFPGQAESPPEFASFMGQIVEKCAGLPLTLEVLGKYLKGNTNAEDWEQTLHALIQAEALEPFDERLWAKLRPSYDGLNDKEQQMFLDAVTFFSSKDSDWSMRKWTLHDAKVAWREAYKTNLESLYWKTLVDRSLVYDVKENESIEMHELLRSLGRKIALESSNKCRVWDRKAALELLQATDGTDVKECFAFQLGRRGWDDANVARPSDNKVKRVQFSELDSSVVVSRSAEDESPNHLGIESSNDDRHGDVDDGDGERDGASANGEGDDGSENGERDDGSGNGESDDGSENGESDDGSENGESDDGSGNGESDFCFGNGESDDGSGNGESDDSSGDYAMGRRISSYRTIHVESSALCKLKKVQFLEFSDKVVVDGSVEEDSCPKGLVLLKCVGLKVLNPAVHSRLVILDLKLGEEFLPSSIGQLTALRVLDLSSDSKQVNLPDEIGRLSNLQQLQLSGWKKLRTLPKTFCNLSNLKRLVFRQFTRLQRLPKSFGRLSALEQAEFLQCCDLHVLPDSFGRLSALKRLLFRDCSELRALPETFGDLSALEHLEFDSCKQLDMPESFGRLSALKNLMFTNGFGTLPNSFGDLSALEHLQFELCYSHALPESFGHLSSLKHLAFRNCFDLRALPDSFGNLSALQDLYFGSCDRLHALPESFPHLSSLKHLEIHRCKSLQALPDSFGDLAALEHLEFSYCSDLDVLPESFGHLPALKHLSFENCGLRALPESFGHLSALQRLEFKSTPVLALSESFGLLSSLEHLQFENCNALQTVAESFGQLPKLQYLKISNATDLCEVEKLLDCLTQLKALRRLVIDCVYVETIPESIKSMRSLQSLELGRLPYVKQVPPWLGDTGTLPLACSHKIFRIQDGQFALAEEDLARDSIGLTRLVHQRAMEKVVASDYEGALVDLYSIDLDVLQVWKDSHHGFLLQERGTLKRLTGDLLGALEDLNRALEIFPHPTYGFGYMLHCSSYDSWKQRGFVKFLLGDIDGAEKDATMALELISKADCISVVFPRTSLAEEEVVYMRFKLKKLSDAEEEMKSMVLSHSQVRDKVKRSDFEGGLRLWDDFDASLSGYYDRAFFLQERGILKRLLGDLCGALEDLNAALEIYEDDYDCFEHRSYVKHLMGDLDGAQSDSEMALGCRLKMKDKLLLPISVGHKLLKDSSFSLGSEEEICQFSD